MALGEIYASQGRYGDARQALEQSLSLYDKLHVEHDVAHAKVSLASLLIALGRMDDAGKQLDDADRLVETAHAGATSAAALLTRAELALARGRREEAAGSFEKANVKANLLGQKELAVQSRIDLARLWLEEGEVPSAEKLLLRTRDEARLARLRAMEAEAAALLGQARLARGDAEGARKEALEAVRLAERLSARPVLHRAQATLGGSLERLGRREEAVDAYARAASTLEWMRGSLRPEDVDSFMARPDVQAFVGRTASALEKGGRAAEAASLRKWTRQASTR
jgi:tetratricopeptide (TPR) repeat protein